MLCRRNFGGQTALLLMEIMLTLLELLAVLVLIAVSLAGFAAAVAWTLAIWFDRSS